MEISKQQCHKLTNLEYYKLLKIDLTHNINFKEQGTVRDYCIHVFPQTSLICVCEVIDKGRYKQQITNLTYYRYPLNQQNNIVCSYHFYGSYQQYWQPYKVNQQSKLVFINEIKNRQYQQNNYNYTICDENGFRTLDLSQLPNQHKYIYFPLTIVQLQNNLLHFKFKIQGKTKYGADDKYVLRTQQLPQNHFLWGEDSNICIYDIIYDCEENKCKTIPIFDQYNKNFQFFNFVKRPEYIKMYDKQWKIFNPTFINPFTFKKLGQQIQFEEYDEFWNSEYDRYSYFQYANVSMLRGNTIRFQTKMSKINYIYLIQDMKEEVTSFLLLETMQYIDQDLMRQVIDLIHDIDQRGTN